MYKRWYDRNTELSQAVRVIMIFPDEIKDILCTGLMFLANKEFDVQEQLSNFRSVGSDKIMGLHKSKNRRREYDENATMHKMMNYLYILGHGNQDYMAQKVLELVGYIQEYLNAVKVFHGEMSLEEVAEITSTFVKGGGEKADELLTSIKEKLHRDLIESGKIDENTKAADFIQDVMDGTKISGFSDQ